jgi:hypothetical protein
MSPGQPVTSQVRVLRAELELLQAFQRLHLLIFIPIAIRTTIMIAMKQCCPMTPPIGYPEGRMSTVPPGPSWFSLSFGHPLELTQRRVPARIRTWTSPSRYRQPGHMRPGRQRWPPSALPIELRGRVPGPMSPSMSNHLPPYPQSKGIKSPLLSGSFMRPRAITTGKGT